MKKLSLLMIALSTLVLSGCYIEARQNLHSNLEHYRPTDFMSTGTHTFKYVDETDQKGSLSLNVDNDSFTASHSDYADFGVTTLDDIVTSNALPSGYYLAVAHEGDAYKYFLFSYQDKTHITFFHNCSSGSSDEEIAKSQSDLIAQAKACIDKNDGTRYVEEKY